MSYEKILRASADYHAGRTNLSDEEYDERVSLWEKSFFEQLPPELSVSFDRGFSRSIHNNELSGWMLSVCTRGLSKEAVETPSVIVGVIPEGLLFQAKIVKGSMVSCLVQAPWGSVYDVTEKTRELFPVFSVKVQGVLLGVFTIPKNFSDFRQGTVVLDRILRGNISSVKCTCHTLRTTKKFLSEVELLGWSQEQGISFTHWELTYVKPGHQTPYDRYLACLHDRTNLSDTPVQGLLLRVNDTSARGQEVFLRLPRVTREVVVQDIIWVKNHDQTLYAKIIFRPLRWVTKQYTEAYIGTSKRFQALGCSINSTVMVGGFEEDRPFVLGVAKPSEYLLPTECPDCKGSLVMGEEGVLRCEKNTCGHITRDIYCFDGSFSTSTKVGLENLARKHGAEVKSWPSKSVTFLVLADPNSDSTKARAGYKNGVSVLTEDQFLERLRV